LRPSILAIDPGDTTGFRRWNQSAQVYGLAACDWVARELDETPVHVVVLEKMNLGDKRARKAIRDLQMGLNVIGFVRWFCWSHEILLVEQTNADKNQVTDDMLEELGLLLTPKKTWRHANDAARHMVFYDLQLLKKGMK
jgi:hypothetical protein